MRTYTGAERYMRKLQVDFSLPQIYLEQTSQGKSVWYDLRFGDLQVVKRASLAEVYRFLEGLRYAHELLHAPGA